MNKEIKITDSAAHRIQHLLKKDRNNTYFRIQVNGGGCAGFQYNFIFTDKKEKNDLIVKKNNIEILIDEVSINLIQGSTVDYVNELIGSTFKINNPKATSSCGCGTSFSI